MFCNITEKLNNQSVAIKSYENKLVSLKDEYGNGT